MRPNQFLWGLAIASLALATMPAVANAAPDTRVYRWPGTVGNQTLFSRPVARVASSTQRRVGRRVVRRIAAGRRARRGPSFTLGRYRDDQRTPSHYVYRDHYPYWAARAFQPAQLR